MSAKAEIQITERVNVPRVVQLGYFDAVLDGVRGGMTFDELRIRLMTVSNDLARFYGRRLPVQGTDPSIMWTTTRDALEGLMHCQLVEDQPVPSKKETLPQYADKKYRLTQAGRELLSQPTAGAQREVLGRRLYEAHPYFRRYLQRLSKGPLFFPEFTETDLDRFPLRHRWDELAAEVTTRVADSPAHLEYHLKDVAKFLGDSVGRRFYRRKPRRKELLDAVLDGIVGFVAHEEGINADPSTMTVLHEWGRQLYLTGSSRYVARAPSGALHWSASVIQDTAEGLAFNRRVLPTAAEPVIQSIGRAYRQLVREGTRLVEYYRLRGTAAFDAGVSNDLVDRVVASMILGNLPNPYGLQPSIGAQWTPPPSERPLRIGDRRYTLVSFSRTQEES